MKKIVDFAHNSINSKTGKNIIINTIGTYLNIAFALFFVLLLTRILGRVEYGTMTVLLNISYVLANVMEFGTTSTIYSFLPDLYYDKSNRGELLSFVKTIFVYQSIASITAIIVLIVSFPALDKHFFKTGSPMIILIWTALSVLGFVWQNTIMNMFFAVKQFFEANVWLNISNIVKTIVILILLPFGFVGPGTVIFVFGVVGPALFLAIAISRYPRLVRELLFETKTSRHHFKVRYTMTNFISAQFMNLAMRMDLFLLSYFKLQNAVADYGLAQKIILTIISTVVSVTQVLSPKYAMIKTKLEAKKELKHSLLFLSIPTAMFLGLVLLPDWFYYALFTNKFADMPLFARLLGVAYVLFCLGQIFNLFHLYTFKKPNVLLWSNILFMIIVTGGCYIMIPRIGAAAGPISLSLAFLTAMTIQGISTKKNLDKLPA
ncbi:MAG: oligosaccharide flippase family protein [Patescibacteria group bacterium]